MMLESQEPVSNSGNHRLIVLEGIDGTGKTTVARKLAAAIGGRYVRTPPPPFDSLRKRIDQHASLETRFLFYLCSVGFASDVIRRELKRRDVVCDRYLRSTVAYHRALGIKIQWSMEELKLAEPDFAFLLYVSDENERIKRIKGRGKTTPGDRLLEDGELRRRMIAEFNRFHWRKVDTTRRNADEVVALIKAQLQPA